MISWDSIPVYNYSYVANAVLPTVAVFTDKYRKLPVWTCEDWIKFFDELKKKYGQEKAKSIWSNYWLMGVSKGAGGKGDPRTGSGLAYDSVPLSCRTDNASFRNFVSKYKMEDTVYMGLGNIAKPFGTVADVVSDAGDSLDMSSKILKYGVPALILTGLGLMVWFGIRKVQSNS